MPKEKYNGLSSYQTIFTNMKNRITKIRKNPTSRGEKKLWGQKLTHTFNLGDILKVLRIWVIIFFCSGNRTGSWCHTHFSIFFIANTYNPFPVSSTSTTPIQENKGLLLFEEFKRKGVKIGSFGRQNWWSWWWKKRRLQQLWSHYQIYKWDWSTVETTLISACLFAILMLFFSDYYKKWFKNLSFECVSRRNIRSRLEKYSWLL